MKLSTFTFCAAVAVLIGALAPTQSRADDIDIFLGNQATGASSAPNVIFLVDNDSNFASSSQKIKPIGQGSGQCSGSCPAVGQSEVDAIVRVIGGLNTSQSHINIGFAELSSEIGSSSSPMHSTLCSTVSPETHLGDGNGTCNSGAFMRFGARDISVAANCQALAKILGFSAPPACLAAGTTANALSIYTNYNDPSEKINSSIKDNAESFYELLQYFESTGSAEKPAFGGVTEPATSPTRTLNPYADFVKNNVFETPKGQSIGTPYALDNSGNANIGNVYRGPPDTTGCPKNYIIHIVNPDQSVSFNLGHQRYANSAEYPPSFTATTGGANSWTPAWTKYLLSKNIKTYVVDVYLKSPPSATFENVAKNEAAQGGGKYYVAQSGDDLLKDINQILVEIQSVNSAFAATALPASATNRSVDQDQVYIGVFRPDPLARPRWYGNLKRYQIVLNNGDPELGDATKASAINTATGFVADCAVSYWTKDSSAYQPTGTTPPAAAPYWSIVSDTPTPSSTCPGPGTSGWALNPANPAEVGSLPQFQPPSGVTWSPFSDSPDGPFVEKGGAADILRRGNVAASASDTFQLAGTARTVLTAPLAGGSPAAFSPSGYTAAQFGSSGTPTGGQIGDYVFGWDSTDENGNTYINPQTSSTLKETRASIHGDVIHSTPLPITYNSSADGVVIYYGSNDGMYHATNANTGVELWSFFAPEFLSRMNRLYTNLPQVAYPTVPLNGVAPTPTPKDYFFDGSTGLYQSSENPPLTDWIYPTMRRGGRMIYGFDVSPSGGSPPTALSTILWKAGCPNLNNDTGCTSGMSALGQTWSKPQIAKIQNGPTDTVKRPTLVVGGGYDSNQTTQSVTDPNGVTSTVVVKTSCEDTNSKNPSCSGRKGSVVYVIDAQSGPGTLLSAIPLPTGSGGQAPGSVIGDIALLDFDGDGVIDRAYLADTTGNVYRLDFVDLTGGTPVVLDSTGWPSHIYRIAHTNNSNEGRKFEFSPTLLVNQGTAAKAYVYVGLGSGDREHPLSSQYPYTTPVQNRFYMFLDDPTSKTTDLNLDSSTLMEDATPSSNTDAGSVACASAGVAGHTAVVPNTFPNPSGWFMNLANDQLDTTSVPRPTNANGNGGEQTVTPAVIIAGQVTWGTNIANPNTVNVCSNNLGNAYGYLADLTNGSCSIGVTGTCGGICSAPYTGGGLPLPPTVGTVGVPDSTSPTGTTYVPICIGCPPKQGGPGAGPAPHNDAGFSGEKRTRVYWFTPNYE
jgi:type IV pilus assembly protein PilY1